MYIEVDIDLNADVDIDIHIDVDVDGEPFCKYKALMCTPTSGLSTHLEGGRSGFL